MWLDRLLNRERMVVEDRMLEHAGQNKTTLPNGLTLIIQYMTTTDNNNKCMYISINIKNKLSLSFFVHNIVIFKIACCGVGAKNEPHRKCLYLLCLRGRTICVLFLDVPLVFIAKSPFFLPTFNIFFYPIFRE